MHTLAVRSYFDRLTKEGIASKKMCGVTSHDKILTILSNVDKEGIWSQFCFGNKKFGVNFFLNSCILIFLADVHLDLSLR